MKKLGFKPQYGFTKYTLRILLLQSFQQFNRTPNFRLLPRRLLRNFTFDGKRPLVTDSFKRFHERAHVDISIPKRHLATPSLSRPLRPGRILAMNAADPRSEFFNSGDRLASPVQ